MIKIFTTYKDYREFRKSIKHNSIGIVPTMGNLHQGHLSLLNKSVDDNKLSVITIFVNPKQFGPNEDFEKYPRTLGEDISRITNLVQKIKNVDKEVVIFAPLSADEVFPPGFNTVISVKGVTEIFEGAIRPGHFSGVTTVVYRLFKIVGAASAYFGQKDYQQCVVIKKMIDDLDLDINMHILPIIRSSEGLALSSRNQYLSAEEKNEALHLSKTLRKIETMIKNKEDYNSLIKTELTNPKWDYLTVVDATDLSEPEANSDVVILGVYKLGQTRLLDNILVHST